VANNEKQTNLELSAVSLIIGSYPKGCIHKTSNNSFMIILKSKEFLKQILNLKG
jgi:hypothetical protein